MNTLYIKEELDSIRDDHARMEYRLRKSGEHLEELNNEIKAIKEELENYNKVTVSVKNLETGLTGFYKEYKTTSTEYQEQLQRVSASLLELKRTLEESVDKEDKDHHRILENLKGIEEQQRQHYTQELNQLYAMEANIVNIVKTESTTKKKGMDQSLKKVTNLLLQTSKTQYKEMLSQFKKHTFFSAIKDVLELGLLLTILGKLWGWF